MTAATTSTTSPAPFDVDKARRLVAAADLAAAERAGLVHMRDIERNAVRLKRLALAPAIADLQSQGLAPSGLDARVAAGAIGAADLLSSLDDDALTFVGENGQRRRRSQLLDEVDEIAAGEFRLAEIERRLAEISPRSVQLAGLANEIRKYATTHRVAL